MWFRSKIKHNNKALRILLLTNGLILFAGAMLGPIYALFVEDVGGNLLDASIAAAVFALAAGITVLVSGRLSDKTGKPRSVIAVGYVVVGTAFFLFTSVNSITSLLLVQVLMGFGEAIYVPAFDSIYSQHLNKHKEASGWGLWEAMNYFIMTIAALTGGLIVTLANFDVLFVVMGLLAIGSAIFLYFLPKKTF